MGQDEKPPVARVIDDQTQLDYRAIRFVIRVGVAPKWIDLILLAGTAVCVFVALIGSVYFVAMAGNNSRPTWSFFLALTLAFIGWGGTYMMYRWSNAFRARRAVSVHELSIDEKAALGIASDAEIPAAELVGEAEQGNAGGGGK